ncbi:alkaline phosphatase [Oleiphilus messinensis]|uniref:Alkaline phosphatase n=1 Tax=Oleiphilus messinensis TaxID=141451 RepID=A0A1Y0I1L3_9GAMM|nr:hypothetical protein [Oleiphilus messinensis]ARU54347.1 alkaline phosphatase [Oleiphilus messinensis]
MISTPYHQSVASTRTRSKAIRPLLSSVLWVALGCGSVAALAASAPGESETAITKAPALENGNIIGRHIFGLARDFQNDPLAYQGKSLFYQAQPTTLAVLSGDQKHALSIFDHEIGSVYITHYDKENTLPVDTEALPLEDIDGLSRPSAPQITPWKTTMVSETTLVNTADPASFIDEFKYYYKNKPDLVNPYNYGWPAEIIVLNAQGEAKVIKNFAMGRVSASHIVILPDQKTVYMLDTLHSNHLYAFIAKNAESMADGTLYVVNTQTDQPELVELGDRSALRVKFKLRKADFSSFFQSSPPEQGNCATGFNAITTTFGNECVKVVKKNAKYTGFMEPIRMAAVKGVNGLPGELLSMAYDSTNNQLILERKNKPAVKFPLFDNPQRNTRFSIEPAQAQ